ncbi:MAG: penicillin acylase family protein [bacterium]
MFKKSIKYVLLLILFSPVFIYFGWRMSLPQLEGAVDLNGLSSKVMVQRDAKGKVSLFADNEQDVWRAAGFVAAQDRFFQMDLMRRASSGYLSELFGDKVVAFDKSRRIHGFKKLAGKVYSSLSQQKKAVLDAYAEGVNAGLDELGTRPFEYVILNQSPQAWQPSDSLLVLYSMYFDLNDETAQYDRDLGRMKQAMPEDVFKFLSAYGSRWDAAIDGSKFALPAIPAELGGETGIETEYVEPDLPGSNNWAVGASRTADGRAIIANDMHLNLRVPHIWYPLSVTFKHDNQKVRACGVNLPGVPAIVAGSNGHVAWGFTNAYVDTTDAVKINWLNDEKTQYQTPDGPMGIEIVEESIGIKGAEPEQFSYKKTIWGPVLDDEFAIAWIAHDPMGSSLVMPDFIKAKNLDELLDMANHTGSPPQNMIAADKQGNIGWTIMGRLPIRENYDSSLPADWSKPGVGWQGWIAPEDMPRIVNPESGQLWSANSRVVGGEALQKLGTGGYGLGARAAQIRDRLSAKQQHNEQSFLDIQLDDEALFLQHWQKLAVEVSADQPEVRQQLQNWSGHASVDSVAYRLVRAFRNNTLAAVRQAILGRYFDQDEKFSPRIPLLEDRVWSLLLQRNDALFVNSSWDDVLQTALSKATKDISENVKSLNQATWGKRNVLSMRHPMSRALPMLSAWLDMPAQSLPGDRHMPRVQSPTFGASERMVVSPGHEAEGYFHMPGGISGHPLSPFYRAGHQDWVEGNPTPFLSGSVEYTMVLEPAS